MFCHFHLYSCIWTWQIISISVVVLADAGFPFYGPSKVLGCICAVPIYFNHLYILFIVFFFLPDAQDFSVRLVSKCCHLLVFYGLNNVKMSQFFFMFTQTLWQWMCEKERFVSMCLRLLCLTLVHTSAFVWTILVQFLQTLAALIMNQIWLLGSSAVSQLMCRNEIVGNKSWYCLNSVALKITKVKSKLHK